MLKQQQITFLRDLALAQIIANKKFDIFEDYQKEMFPWYETAQKRERVDYIKKLMEAVKAGPLQVQTVHAPVVKSRLSRVKKVNVTDDLRKQQNELYSRLGNLF